MAILHCPECKKKVSDKAPACPNCGVVYSKKFRPKQKVPWIPLSFMALFMVMIFTTKPTKTSEDRQVRTASKPLPGYASWSLGEAIYFCGKAIESAAAYKVIKKPGHSKNYGSGNEFYFSWPRGKIVLQNGFGAQINSSAACIGNLAKCQITSLSINGESIIGADLGL